MRNLDQIARARRVPGVMILDDSGVVLYRNSAVADVVPTLEGVAADGGSAPVLRVPAAIRDLCLTPESHEADPATTIVCSEGICYALKAVPLESLGGAVGKRCVMLLIEPIVEHRQVNFDAIKSGFNLSRREVEVLRLVCQGMSNREIAERLFISEYTAKDHVKKIMQAFNASSRSEVIASLSL